MIYGFCLINMIMRAACDCFASVTQNFYTENYECLFIYFEFFGEMLFIQLAACDKTDYSFSVLCNLNTGTHEYIIICWACFNADLPWKIYSKREIIAKITEAMKTDFSCAIQDFMTLMDRLIFRESSIRFSCSRPMMFFMNQN